MPGSNKNKPGKTQDNFYILFTFSHRISSNASMSNERLRRFVIGTSQGPNLTEELFQ